MGLVLKDLCYYGHLRGNVLNSVLANIIICCMICGQTIGVE